MRVITAPNEVILEDGEVSCFLAGGITGCSNWQDRIIDILSKIMKDDKLVLLNPRRTDFDISNPNASMEQIEWEFNALNNADIFSMYFDNSGSVQPICFYELGRHLERMQHRFPDDYSRIIVNVVSGFSRQNDVIIQTKLATGRDIVNIIDRPDMHAHNIYDAYYRIK